MRVKAGEARARDVEKVLLDGAVVEDVIWADDEAGELERYKTRDGVRYCVGEGDQREMATEVLRGRVEIRFKGC